MTQSTTRSTNYLRALFLLALLLTGKASYAGDLTVEFVRSFGMKGAGPGRFNEPYSAAVDADGNVYVTDVRNKRVQKFTSEGEFILEFGGRRFAKPVGIAVGPDGFVYVTDYDRDTIEKFDSRGRFISSWGSNGSGDGEFDSPSDIAIDEDGFLFVADTYNHRIQKFDGSGKHLKTWGEEGKVEDLQSYLSSLFSTEKPGEFHYPAKIAARSGKVFVSDSYNNRVQVFTAGGEYLWQWGGRGIFRGSFRVASGIATDPEGRVFVADYYNNRVQVFDTKGKFLASFGSKGIGRDEFQGPTGVAYGKGGYLYVTDWGNHRVQVFRIKR